MDGSNLDAATINQIKESTIMKKIMTKTEVFFRYLTVMVLIMCGVLALVFSPDFYKVSDLNFGPVLALVCTGIATLVWNTVDD